MTLLRLLADDLTGALDTAAEFVGLCGPLDVSWTETLPSSLTGSLVIDSGTRERDRSQVLPIMERLVPVLDGASIAFKKVDSLMRGEWAAELAVCLRANKWTSCIVAPAFAYQGRRTRDGQQFARAQDGSWLPVGRNIFEQLAAEGIEARPGHPGAVLSSGVTVYDAESEEDLDRVVAAGRRAMAPRCGSAAVVWRVRWHAAMR